jgi:hypothetical protein
MTIAGGGPNQEALDNWYEDDEEKQKRLESQDKLRKERIAKQEHNTLRIMEESWGREWMWEFVVNAPILRVNPYTRNADTYHLLGEQRQAKQCCEYLKALCFTLYQKMESEARNREIDKRKE